MAHNVKAEIKSGKLILTIDIGKASVDGAPTSKSGKSRLLASTGGFTSLQAPDGSKVSYSVNVSV